MGHGVQIEGVCPSLLVKRGRDEAHLLGPRAEGRPDTVPALEELYAIGIEPKGSSQRYGSANARGSGPHDNHVRVQPVLARESDACVRVKWPVWKSTIEFGAPKYFRAARSQLRHGRFGSKLDRGDFSRSPLTRVEELQLNRMNLAREEAALKL